MKLTEKYRRVYEIRRDWEKAPMRVKLRVVERLFRSTDDDLRQLALELDYILMIVSWLKPT